MKGVPMLRSLLTRSALIRTLRIVAALAGSLVLLVVLAVAAVVAGLNTDPGRRLAERLAVRATGGQVMLAGLAGTFPVALRLDRIELRDAAGVWLTVQDARVRWSPLRLLAGEAHIDLVAAGSVALARLPTAADVAPEPAAGPAATTPASGAWPVRIDLARLCVDRLELGAPVAGVAAVLSVDGSARLASLQSGEAAVTLLRLDGPGSYRVYGRIDGTALRAQMRASEAARGLAGQLAGLPDLGAIDAIASLDGKWNAAGLKLAVSAGSLRAEASGTLDLTGMAGDVDMTAHAPSMRPRPDLSWQGVALEAHLHGSLAAPEAIASLQLDGLEAAGAGLRRLEMRATGHAGAATLAATAEGLRLPGPKPDLFAAAPWHLSLDAGLDDAGRPLRFSLTHPLLALAGTARTQGALSAEATLTLPDLAPLAAAGGADVQGRAALTLKAARDEAGAHLDVDGTLGVTGGMAPLPALVGPDGRLGLTALLHGADMTLSRLDVTGRALTVAAQGGLRGGAVGLDWRVGLADLAALARTLQGSLVAQGHAGGRTDDISVSLDLSGDVATQGFPRGPVHAVVQAQGLPGHPFASATAEGTLDGAPLALAAQAARAADGALRLDIARADWRSAHADGVLDLPAGATLPLGTLTLKLGDLAEFSRFAGQSLAGAIDARLRTEQQGGAPIAVLDVTARNAGLPGTAAVGEATLAARVRDPAGTPVTEARLTLAGLRAGGIGGGLRLDAAGPQAALALRVSASLTGVSGADLALQGSATLDAPGRTLGVASLQAGWKGETLRLLAPARLSFAGGAAVDRLRLGLRDAVLEVAGRASPTLDLTASLRNVTGELLAIADPGLKAEGKLQADARLAGTAARPTGTLRLTATGMRLRTGPAAGLPAASLTANATLQGQSAQLDAALTAGANRLTLAGSAPLAAAGAMDLRAAGTLDLATLDPILAVNGRQARGRVILDATLAGTVAAPRAGGSLRLAGGEMQDFALGARLSDIEALVQAEGDSVRIARFAARAGKGTISAGGTIGLAAPMPVALTLTMRNASPLASDQLTAVLDADLSLRGAVAGRLDAAGKIIIQRADIRIPERIPATVAVLDVRIPGQKPPPPPAPGPAIGLDVTLRAPSRIFLRGRGVDAELSGDLHIGGTAAAPLPDGSFKLRRGQYTLAGTTLDFTRGEVGFDGSGRIDPTLNFLASSDNGTVVANMAITGYASAPKIALSSTPPLPQDEVLAWLLFHQSSATLSPLQLVQIVGALAQITGVGGGGPGVLDRVRTGLGLDRLAVGSGAGGTGTAVEAGRYVSEGVYVGAKQGTSGSGTQAIVQVDLARGLKAQATVGQSQGATGASTSGQDSGTSVGITYQFQDLSRSAALPCFRLKTESSRCAGIRGPPSLPRYPWPAPTASPCSPRSAGALRLASARCCCCSWLSACPLILASAPSATSSGSTIRSPVTPSA